MLYQELEVCISAHNPALFFEFLDVLGTGIETTGDVVNRQEEIQWYASLLNLLLADNVFYQVLYVPHLD